MKEINIKKDGTISHSTRVENEDQKQSWLEKNLNAFPEGFEVEEIDLTEKVEAEQKLLSRKEIREACAGLLDVIGIVNAGADDGKMDAIFMNPSFVAVGLALLAGAPKTAKRYILQIGPSLYPQEQIDSLIQKLDAIIASEGV